MTASNLTAEQVLEKAIAWLLDDGKIGPDTANRLRQHCLPVETDKQKALRLLHTYGCPILRLSANQVELIRSVVERCPDSSPAPAPSKPKLAVGQIWRRRDGKTATVDKFRKCGDDDGYPWGAGGEWYTSDGRYSLRMSHLPFDPYHPFDLVEHIGHVSQIEPRSCEH